MAAVLRLRLLSFVGCCLLFTSAFAQEKREATSEKWEKEIAAFEAADAKSPPAKGGILFVGSSSIRLWDLKKSFPEMTLLNRGFGGSQVHDSLELANRIILPYEPRTIFVYAGDNDIASGKTPEVVAENYRQLVKVIHAKLPEAKIHFIAIKPSPSRWKLYEKQQAANRLIADFCGQYQPAGRLTYIDIVKPMLGEDGQPRANLFRDDKLHLNEAGYQVWRELVLPLLSVTSAK